ncbi:MAG: hypothetical protein DIJKHBIC_03599 [Thermoanaerobaculia bacterium]|nr:hypothetical protein [Thermoanaerobaculia bacterium]
MNETVPLTVFSPAVERGIGLFETVLLRGRNAILFFEHWERFSSSVQRLELPAPRREEFLEAAEKAIDAAGVGMEDVTERALRLAFVAAGNDLDDPSSWRLDASVRKIPAWTLERRAGARTVTLPSWIQRDTPGIKSTSYFGAVIGQRVARHAGGNEGLLVDSAGHYLEGTSTGLAVWVEESESFVAALGPALSSVTLAAFLAHEPQRRPLTAEDIRAGAVLAGSLTRVVPARELDGRPCSVPDRMLERVEAFNRRLEADPLVVTAF